MNCNLCGSPENALLWKVGDYSIYKCQQCSLIYADVKPEDVAHIYDEDYYENVYPDYHADKAIHEMNATLLLDKIEKSFPKGKLLEIGSAFGFFLKSAENRGWTTTGIEFSEYASEIARKKYGLNVVGGDFLNISLDEKFDVICLFDTIEHILDANAVLEKIVTMLRPGGGIILTTGDIGTFHAKSLGKKWRLIAPPFHVYYYSAYTLSLLLQKHHFSILSVNHKGKYFNIGSILQYFLKCSKNNLPIMPIKINTFDIMTIMARSHS